MSGTLTVGDLVGAWLEIGKLEQIPLILEHSPRVPGS